MGNVEWEIKTLLDLSVSIEDGDWIEKKDQSTSGIRLIQTGNVGQGCYKDKGEKAKYKKLLKYSLIAGMAFAVVSTSICYVAAGGVVSLFLTDT